MRPTDDNWQNSGRNEAGNEGEGQSEKKSFNPNFSNDNKVIRGNNVNGERRQRRHIGETRFVNPDARMSGRPFRSGSDYQNNGDSQGNNGGYGNNRGGGYGDNRGGGYGNNRGGGYGDNRGGGYGNNRGGGYGDNRGGGYGNNRGGGYGDNRGGGYGNNRGGGYGDNRGGGYGNNRGGGYGDNRGGGYGNNRGGGYGNNRGGGYGDNRGGGYGNNRGGGYGDNRGGGYGNNRGGGYGNNRGGGYGNNRGGGYGNNRGGGFNRGGMQHNNVPQRMPQPVEYDIQYDPEEEVRLNKFLANAGVCSRREADLLIQAGAITVNGTAVTELGTKIHRADKVMIHDQTINPDKRVYLLLNKPKDCVTTTDDPNAKLTVMDLVKNACRERIYPVGRLDRNTTGVLLLTNDGDLAAKLTHPKFNKKKVYEVVLDHELSEEDYNKIMGGITLDDGDIKPDELSISEEDPKKVGIEIHSGRNRIVRRIFESCGYRVIRLDRTYFAGLTKKNLRRGQWRFLSNEEVNKLRMGSFE
ncbi:MAG: rRNA pseudouridine synthase [Paludibacteraceae bacterium]|nr:rRNA pseudouridine synthase [Paludibacteraceae bacterium]